MISEELHKILGSLTYTVTCFKCLGTGVYHRLYGPTKRRQVRKDLPCYSKHCVNGFRKFSTKSDNEAYKLRKVAFEKPKNPCPCKKVHYDR